MKEVIHRWLSRNPPGSGVIACGVWHPDATSYSQVIAPDFSENLLQQIWRSVAATFAQLQSARGGATQMRWVFDKYFLYCATRADGSCLGVLTTKIAEDLDEAGVTHMLSEFMSLRGPTGR